MIPVSPTLIVHAFLAALCIVGFELIGGKRAKLGYILSGLGSLGWLLAAPSVFFMLQAAFFLWASARGYERSK